MKKISLTRLLKIHFLQVSVVILKLHILHVKNAGLDTGSAKTTIAGTDDSGTGRDGQIVGVKFAIEATYNGKPVKPGIVMTSGGRYR